MAKESRIAVYGAIVGNVSIAVTKFVGAAMTGSSAMLSEGIHSVVDSGNGLLLLFGMNRASAPADAEHPFGHGKELYFWSLIVAVLIFGAGGGVSAYEGILHMLHPNPVSDPTLNYVVLGFAAVFEGTSLGIALRQFSKEKGDAPFWQALHDSKDPGTYTVIAEDSAALLGIAAAFIGVFASHQLDLPVLDGAASVVIGLLLMGVATLLIREARGLLIGEGVSRETLASIRSIVDGEAGVNQSSKPLTMYFGPDDVLLALDVQFDPALSSGQIAECVRNLEHKIRERHSFIKRIYVEARALDPQTARAGGGPR